MAKEASASSGAAPSWGLVLVRIYVGWILVSAGWMKLRNGVGEELVSSTRDRIQSAPHWYRWFGEDVVLAHPQSIAVLIIWGELIGGALLFLGALVRPVSVGVMFLMLNLYVAGPAMMESLTSLIGVCALAFFVSRAGRRLGVDGLLVGRLPRWLTLD
jgi:uncharacterized membrane protein YphA (DoxX/SURF4 family)